MRGSRSTVLGGGGFGLGDCGGEGGRRGEVSRSELGGVSSVLL